MRARVYLIPSDMELTLFERETSRTSQHGRLRATIAALIQQVRPIFDVVLIDCPPGLSVLTECWLREADFHLSPTKADYVSVCGLEVFRRFKSLNPEMGFAENIGVAVNMKDRMSGSDEDYHKWLRESADNRCFEQAIPRINALQDAARFSPDQRSYSAKYPGEAGQSVRALTKELLARLAEANAAQEAAATATPPAPPPLPEKDAPGKDPISAAASAVAKAAGMV